MHYQPPGEEYDPCASRCCTPDNSPGESILLLHKDKDFVPSTPMPAYNATDRQVRKFFVSIMLEREMPIEIARSIAKYWYGNGMEMHIVNFDSFHCWFKDKNARVLFTDVQGINVRESQQLQRQRVARRERAKLAMGEFRGFFCHILDLLTDMSVL